MTISQHTLPYGKRTLDFHLPDDLPVMMVTPRAVAPAPDPIVAVQQALAAPVGGVRLADFAGAGSAAIAINDKTRPVPHAHLLPPLLAALEDLGLPPANISLIIATGSHPPMPPAEYAAVLPPDVLARYPVLCHDAAAASDLIDLGRTTAGTPVQINRHFLAADLRIVVGNIEPHQFQGFSGGVKSAAIGLAGKETINVNHAMMTHPAARLGRYADNPARQDVEAIGRMIGVHFALNAILNHSKQIVEAVAGDPAAVMAAGIPLARQIYESPAAQAFDLVIASPGGHPKDLNVYQAQKALNHAALITRPGGGILIAAACTEGSGSPAYEHWMAGMSSHEAVIARFSAEPFRTGPHKAFQIARDAVGRSIWWVSDLPVALAQTLLLNPAPDLDTAIAAALAALPPRPAIAILPWANTTIPRTMDDGR